MKEWCVYCSNRLCIKGNRKTFIWDNWKIISSVEKPSLMSFPVPIFSSNLVPETCNHTKEENKWYYLSSWFQSSICFQRGNYSYQLVCWPGPRESSLCQRKQVIKLLTAKLCLQFLSIKHKTDIASFPVIDQNMGNFDEEVTLLKASVPFWPTTVSSLSHTEPILELSITEKKN